MTELLTAGLAEEAARAALAEVDRCINERKSFVLEAGAGAGKTYSLIHALQYLVAKEGADLLRRGQQIACITFTNAARDEIESRTDGHPAVLSATIHSFCWTLLSRFQPELRKELPAIAKWPERLEETGGIGSRRVDYDLGYPSARNEEFVSLGHNDVLTLMVELLKNAKFRALLVDRYPVIFIDEYQDTNKQIADALKEHFVSEDSGLLLGFFGDHWQKIYGEGCGRIEDPSLHVINKHANFRSVTTVVDVLNRIRPELIQHPANVTSAGSAVAFHTNSWSGTRQTGAHWKGDLPADIAHEYLTALKDRLTDEGWDFAPSQTKILMLTHNVLAEEQGYRQLADVFPYNDTFIKKEDDHIAFFADVLEPASDAYRERRYGEMFAVFGGKRPKIHSTSDKRLWTRDMDELLELQVNGSIGDVMDQLLRTERIQLPDKVERKERDLKSWSPEAGEEKPSWIDRLEKLRAVPYGEVVTLVKFINGYTPFATKHGVKGLEFENVLVVVGRGWNQYNFNQMLEWAGSSVPSGKQETFERSRNLFYVSCSRSKTRLALLFTEELSAVALATLTQWFGASNVESFQVA